MHAQDDTLHAFILPTEERALADARAAEARVMAGDAKARSMGSRSATRTSTAPPESHDRALKLLEHNVPAQDANTVRKWAEAGSADGQAAAHEFAMGGPSFDLPWPPARNPWNPEHFTSGSSSGTGAAVAAGMILGGTGSDTGGSIRGPAALCGIAGIKPTYGLVAGRACCRCRSAWTTPGRWPGRWKTAPCCCRPWRVRRDRSRQRRSPGGGFPRRHWKGVKGLRIGVVRHFFETDNPASPAMLAGIDHALDVFEHLGAEISEVTLSPMAEYHACGGLITDVGGVCGPRAVAEDAVQ